jgi:hypothetical protein
MRFVFKTRETKAQFDEAEDQLSVHARQKEEGKYLLFFHASSEPSPLP